MRLSNPMEQALNEQLYEELGSFYIYLAMAADFSAKQWPGMAKWMELQAKEELGHAMRFYRFILERGGQVRLKALPQPQESWETPLAAFSAALAHEQHITGRIHALVELARQHKDYPSEVFLQWFVTEQVEEEAQLEPIIHRLKLAGDHPPALFILDRELAAREEEGEEEE
ncbi:MAG: ferritin [Thermoanaerobaculum sp.]|nr:ferritin [Thermoanaerobaculum sp.]MDW7968186.1 ferritin [Thermoanaerobaculum sp.]